MSNRLKIIDKDPWLEPVEGELNHRYARFHVRLEDIERSSGSIVDYDNGYSNIGYHRDESAGGWGSRGWLPGEK